MGIPAASRLAPAPICLRSIIPPVHRAAYQKQWTWTDRDSLTCERCGQNTQPSNGGRLTFSALHRHRSYAAITTVVGKRILPGYSSRQIQQKLSRATLTTGAGANRHPTCWGFCGRISISFSQPINQARRNYTASCYRADQRHG